MGSDFLEKPCDVFSGAMNRKMKDCDLDGVRPIPTAGNSCFPHDLRSAAGGGHERT